MKSTFLGLLLLISPFFAMSQDDLDFSEMSLEDLLNVEVTVASKDEETAADAPSTVTVFTRREILNLGITNLYDLLNYVPGFQVMRDVRNSTNEAVHGRGFLRSDQGRDLLFLVDGTRLNNSHFGGASGISKMISTDNIKQVEIIRGPGSALYGSNAFLGVVNIVTESDASDVNVRFGDNELRDLAINYSHEANGLKISAFGRVFSYGGELYSGFGEFAGRNDSTDDPADGSDLHFKINYQKFTLTGYFQERTLENFYNFGRVANDLSRSFTKATFIEVGYKALDTDKQLLNFVAGVSDQEWDALTSLVPESSATAPVRPFQHGDLIGGPHLESFYRNFAVDYQYRFSDSFTLFTGATFEQTGNENTADQLNYDTRFLARGGSFGEFLENGFPHFGGSIHQFSGFTGDFAESFVLDEDRDILGIYAQGKIRFGQYVKLILGGRFDDYSDFGNTFNPRGAFIADTPWKGKFKVIYGEAFRAPTFAELYTINNPVLEGNADLEPEEIETLELAYVQSFSKFQGSITYFDNSISNILATEPVGPNSPLLTTRNGGEADTEGFEAEFTASLGKAAILRGAYTNITDGAHFAFPEDFGSVALNIKAGKWNINISNTYRGDVYLADPYSVDDNGNLVKDPNTPMQDSFFLWNAGVRWGINNNFFLQAGGQNIGDEDYVSFTPNGRVNVPGKGRSGYIGFYYKY